MYYWNPWAAWLAIAATVELGFALWVFAVRPDRQQNRRLAGLVFCDAVLVLGGGVAGLLLFAIAPLQRLGERVANAALPHVEDTAAYRDNRARELYAAAWEAAMKDGTVTHKERDVLATLQEKLGLKPTEALAIERGVA